MWSLRGAGRRLVLLLLLRRLRLPRILLTG
jgi:hypothetical protein